MYIKDDNMELIIDFYKELDTLNLIIFWGIIIVIILLLVFSLILINKNKKLKRIVEKQNKYEEEIPIKKHELINEIISEKEIEIKQETKETNKISTEENNTTNSIQADKEFVAEELVSEYQKTDYNSPSESSIYIENKDYVSKVSSNIEIPTKPYQRNVLREMSLSQTSPIGINRINVKDNKKIEMAKDLEKSLNEQEKEFEMQIKVNKEDINNVIKKENLNIKGYDNPKKEINKEELQQSYNNLEKNKNKVQIKDDEIVANENIKNNILENYQDLSYNKTENKEKKSSEKYLEEVSRKLSEAEVPDEIERTNYEIQQEEDAIISYKELMEKKDTIQTIDEEEAVISIEELMNRENKKSTETYSDTKLYNLGEEEANDSFIKELKQFRKDL